MHWSLQFDNTDSMEGLRNEDPKLAQNIIYFLKTITFCPNTKIFDFEKYTRVIPGMII